jgi:hypothetical protein
LILWFSFISVNIHLVPADASLHEAMWTNEQDHLDYTLSPDAEEQMKRQNWSLSISSGKNSSIFFSSVICSNYLF